MTWWNLADTEFILSFSVYHSMRTIKYPSICLAFSDFIMKSFILAAVILVVTLPFQSSSFVAVPTLQRRPLVNNIFKDINWALQQTFESHNEKPTTLIQRRDLISKSAAVVAVTLLGNTLGSPRYALAQEVSGIGTDPDHPVVIIGAGGKVSF